MDENSHRDQRQGGWWSSPLWLGAALVITTLIVWGLIHWSYRATIAAKDAHIASLQRRVDGYRDALNGATAEEARRRLDATDAELRALRLRLSPRRLSPAQRQAIIDRSRRPAGTERRDVALLVDPKCSDCAAFADDIAEALRGEDNWAVAIRPLDAGARARHALEIRVSDPNRPSAEASVLQQALRSAGQTFFMVAGPPGTLLELVVADRATTDRL